MTKEAKIGLLLGLGFIVAIAVVLRDVHQQDTDLAELNPAKDILNPGVTLEAVQKIESDSQAAGNNSGNLINIKLPATADSSEPTNVQKGDNPGAAKSAGDTGDNGKYRYTMNLPSLNADGNNNNSSNIVTPPGGDIERAINRAVVEENNTFTPPGGDPGSEDRGNIVALDLQGLKNTFSQSRQSPGQIYTVQKFDTLSKIAKKIYGPVEGNKKANIRRIFQANRKVLKSENFLKIGQKLVIPPLASRQGNQPVSSGKLKGKAVNQTKTTVIYIVKKNDSLWTIAATQLGNPMRYKEILRLNSDKIRNENDITENMKLRLPPK